MVNLPSSALATLCFVESYKLPLEKKKATIIGRSDSVGLPIALLLTHKNMTCQVTPSHTELNETLLKDVLVGSGFHVVRLRHLHAGHSAEGERRLAEATVHCDRHRPHLCFHCHGRWGLTRDLMGR